MREELEPESNPGTPFSLGFGFLTYIMKAEVDDIKDSLVLKYDIIFHSILIL